MSIKKYKDKHLHLISFDIPVPANYGGAIDIYYKLRALNEAGIKTHLHCFQYDRQPAKELNELCYSTIYYKRDISKTNLFKRLPYIVATRSSVDLIKNILQDEYPILFEGLHSCYYLNDKRLKNRKKVVRTHNIEHDYYANLAKVEKNLFKRYYFLNETSKLKRYESILRYADSIAAISENDKYYFTKSFNKVERISAFHPHENVFIKKNKGKYAFYHGSLDVGENNEAALFLVTQIFNDLEVPLIIAGSKPHRLLKDVVSKFENIELISNVNTEKIYELISNAQINILPTFQSTGIKLKLLASLFIGRHCIVNTPMVKNTGLEELCSVKDSVNEIKNEIIRLMKIPFTSDDIERRKKILRNNGFSNNFNINKLCKLIFE
jgi:hypothetical protein